MGVPLSILWVGKQSTDEGSGEEVYDSRVVASLRKLGHHVEICHPEPVSRLREAALLATCLLPYLRTRYATLRNRRAIVEKSRSVDVVIGSWEPFDALLGRLPRPCILIVHNIISRSLPALLTGSIPALFTGSIGARFGAYRARLWERRHYRAGNFAAIGALSNRDLAYLDTLAHRPRLLRLTPGMPRLAELAPDAEFKSEIVLSGTFGWFPKRRDTVMFAQQYAKIDNRFQVRAEALPEEAVAALHPLSAPSADEIASAIRLGVIPDCFEAGHKLRTLAYIANNQIVLSFSDVSFDFEHIPDHDLFIQRLHTVEDIARVVSSLRSIPLPELRDKFRQFKQACARSFTWQVVAERLAEASREIIASRQPRAAQCVSEARAKQTAALEAAAAEPRLQASADQTRMAADGI